MVSALRLYVLPKWRPPLLKKRPNFDESTMAGMIQPEDMAKTALFVADMQPGVALHEIVLAPVRK